MSAALDVHGIFGMPAAPPQAASVSLSVAVRTFLHALDSGALTGRPGNINACDGDDEPAYVTALRDALARSEAVR